ncbi:MAG: hypothetical protein JWM99_691 [Verrucomicrobiales bacterium]|nr:hypothetical protein [Verrucomicrobiales bacterium]
MQNSTTPKLKEFAVRLLAYETDSSKSVGLNQSAVFRLCEKLRVPLCKLMGIAGYRTLFSRALGLAGGEVRWLRGLHVRSDGTLEGVDELEARLVPEQITQGELVLVARLLGLLVTFIGPALTLQLVEEAWPGTGLEEMTL